MIVLDASALLALVWVETGSDVVAEELPDSTMSVASLAEVLAKAADHGLPVTRQHQAIDALGIRMEPVTARDATISAELRALDAVDGRPVLSLGDRLCLSLARRLDLPVLTADRAWADVAHGVEVQLLR